MERNYEPIVIKNAHIFKTNFAGKEIPPYNPAGRRNFLVAIPDRKVAQDMYDDGWNIKMPKDEEEGKDPFLSVAVNFDFRPPKIVVESSKGRTRIDEDSVDMLDWAEKTQVDLSINPRYWEDDRGNQRIKAYLRTMRIVIFEDELERDLDFDEPTEEDEDTLPFD